ncbi:MAG: 50S ribosomal protein L4 [Candidatus Paceibacterota bacterium]
MKVEVFDKQNNKIGEIDLPERIFGLKWNADLVHQALIAQLGNSREPLAHAKGRGEVRGGGKKPWKQKGTGRARHGSIRSPIWKGGGVTFGPNKERNFSKKINAKMNRLAIFTVLSRKVKDNDLKVVESFAAVADKTKDWNTFLKGMIDLRSKALIIPTAENNINKTISNIKNVSSINPKSLNVRDLLKAKNIIIEKQTVSDIEKHYK